MALEKIKNQWWFKEELYPDVAQSIKISKILARKTTHNKNHKLLQKLLIAQTPRFGKILVLDEALQTTELDEAYYHDPLVHCAIFSHPDPKNILIIGGGDGGPLKEAVKHPVKTIDLVDIDEEVIGLVKKHMPEFAQNSWQDPRVKVYIEDGAKFIKKTRKKYDVIIIDSPDPIGPAVSLFKTSFYLDCKKILSSQGVIIRQTGSSIFQPDEMPISFRQMEELFPEAAVFLTAVPTYVGGYFTFVAGSLEKGRFKKALKNLNSRFNEVKLKTSWYTPQMHKSAMVLPRELQSSLKKTEYGQELIIDLYNCDYQIITSREKLLEFARKTCVVIKMKPFGRPFVADFGFSLSKTAGPSLVQLIESSSITAHYSPHWQMVCLNIFTCTGFDARKTVEFAKNFFGANRARAFLLKRGPRNFKENLEIQNIKN